jgi:chromosome segregation ATPase
LLNTLTELRRKLVYAARLDSAKQLQNKLQLDIDMHKSELASYEQRFRENELELARTKRDINQWEKRARRSEAKAAQWEQQVNLIEDRRYTESIRAEGAISILRSQISALQKEVQEQTRRKLGYKKKVSCAGSS